MATRIADDRAACGRRGSGVSNRVRYLRITTIAMLIVGVIAIIAGATTDIGPFGILFGLLMLVSGVVKIIALRIMDGQPPVMTRAGRDER